MPDSTLEVNPFQMPWMTQGGDASQFVGLPQGRMLPNFGGQIDPGARRIAFKDAQGNKGQAAGAHMNKTYSPRQGVEYSWPWWHDEPMNQQLDLAGSQFNKDFHDYMAYLKGLIDETNTMLGK